MLEGVVVVVASFGSVGRFGRYYLTFVNFAPIFWRPARAFELKKLI